MLNRAANYQATFDALALIGRLEDVLMGLTDAEVQLLAYLSCLLSVYRGRPASEWGYSFVRSSWGAPYSIELSRALETAQARGLITRGTAVRLSDEGRAFLSFLEQRVQHAWRSPFLEGAAGSALAIPAGLIRSALRDEPSFRSAAIHLGARELLDAESVEQLHAHFEALDNVVGRALHDLMIPSVIWIRYLLEVGENQGLGSADWVERQDNL